MGVRELDHPLAQIGLDDVHAHRLDLGHNRTVLTAGRVPADLPDNLPGRGRVLCEMDLASHRLEAFGEPLHQLWQALEVGEAALLEVSAAGREVEALEPGLAPAPQTGHGLDEGALPLGVVEGLVDAPTEVAPGLRHAFGWLLGLPRRPLLLSTPGPSIWSRRIPRRDRRHWARSPRTDALAALHARVAHCLCSP